jgi:hypothetical protein
VPFEVAKRDSPAPLHVCDQIIAARSQCRRSIARGLFRGAVLSGVKICRIADGPRTDWLRWQTYLVRVVAD